MTLILLLLLVFLCGVGAPVQTVVNSRLRNYVVSPFVASLVSFVVGLAALAIIALIQYRTLALPPDSMADIPWWGWVGGLCGAVGIVANVVLFPKLGGVLTVLLPMLGQVLMGVLIDSFGLFGAQYIPLSAMRIGGVVLALIGSYLVVSKKDDAINIGSHQIHWMILGVVGGLLLGMQPSVNSVLAVAFDSSLLAALVSFAVGTIALLAFILCTKDRQHLTKIVVGKAPWWSYLGGLMGALFVTAFAYFASRISISLLNIVNIFGMLVAGVVVDRFGLLGSRRLKIDPWQYFGLALILLGIIAIQYKI